MYIYIYIYYIFEYYTRCRINYKAWNNFCCDECTKTKVQDGIGTKVSLNRVGSNQIKCPDLDAADQFVRNRCLQRIGGERRQTNKRWEYRTLAVSGSSIHHYSTTFDTDTTIQSQRKNMALLRCAYLRISNRFCNFLRQPMQPGIRRNTAEIDREDP